MKELEIKEIKEELEEREWNEMLTLFPKTQEMLPYTFLWSTSDCFAPNGNDSGFDVMSAFRESNKGYPKKAVFTFLTQFLKGWEIDVLNPYDEDDISYTTMIYYQVVVSLAIAVIKVKGIEDKKLSQMARDAIDKYLKEIETETKWEHLAECREKTLLIREVLKK